MEERTRTLTESRARNLFRVDSRIETAILLFIRSKSDCGSSEGGIEMFCVENIVSCWNKRTSRRLTSIAANPFSFSSSGDRSRISASEEEIESMYSVRRLRNCAVWIWAQVRRRQPDLSPVHQTHREVTTRTSSNHSPSNLFPAFKQAPLNRFPEFRGLVFCLRQQVRGCRKREEKGVRG